MKSEYPILPSQPTPQDMEDWIRDVTRLRQLEDLPDFTNLPNVFVAGRRVERTTPTSHSDVLATDSEGDWFYGFDGSDHRIYVLVNDSGTLKWARFNVNVSWS
jgi:hypothetical protein